MSQSRRRFLGTLAATAAGTLVGPLAAQNPATDTATVRGDFLRDPGGIGRPRDTVTAIDNDPVVIGIERQLRCTCGCTLDIYTCRTTDFTCSYSPALHKEVVGLVEQGKTPEEVIAFFVEREGEKILMAPVAEGFNLAGYLVPGLGIAVAGLMLAAYLSRRREAVAVTAGGSAPPPAPDAEAIERLKRALDEVES